MSVDSDAGQLKSEADEPGWEVDLDDAWRLGGGAIVGSGQRPTGLRCEAAPYP